MIHVPKLAGGAIGKPKLEQAGPHGPIREEIRTFRQQGGQPVTHVKKSRLEADIPLLMLKRPISKSFCSAAALHPVTGPRLGYVTRVFGRKGYGFCGVRVRLVFWGSWLVRSLNSDGFEM
jgi:hypothetical protein